MTATGKGSCDVLVVGEYFCDLIFSGLSDVPKPGAEFFADGLTMRPGGCYTSALALTRLGVASAWAADFGTDIFSRIVLSEAERDGIDSRAFHRLDDSAQRVSAAFSHRGERGFISFSETEVTPPDPRLLDRLKPKWLLQTFRFDAEWLDFLLAAKARGIKIFGDCRHGDFDLSTPGVRQFIGLLDVFSPNEAEALALTGKADITSAIEELAAITPTVIVKRGPFGASAIDRGKRVDAPAPVVDVVDTVGAGDAFNAGFLAGTVWGSGLAECVRLAVACGSLSTTGTGSGAVPTAAELASFTARTAGVVKPACGCAPLLLS